MTPQEARVVPSHTPRMPFWACVRGASLAAVVAGGGAEVEPALSDAPEAHPARAVAITAPIMAAPKTLAGKRFESIAQSKAAAAVRAQPRPRAVISFRLDKMELVFIKRYNLTATHTGEKSRLVKYVLIRSCGRESRGARLAA